MSVSPPPPLLSLPTRNVAHAVDVPLLAMDAYITGVGTDQPSSPAAAGKVGAGVDPTPKPSPPTQAPAATAGKSVAHADQVINSYSPKPVVSLKTAHRGGMVGRNFVFGILAFGFGGLGLVGGKLPLLGLLLMTQFGFVALFGLLRVHQDERRKSLLIGGEGKAATKRWFSLPAVAHQVVIIVPLGVTAAGFALLGAGYEHGHHPEVPLLPPSTLIPALLFVAAQIALLALLRALLVCKTTESCAIYRVLPVQQSASNKNSRFTTTSICTVDETTEPSSPASSAV